jgi:hypothetical protein
LPPVADRTVSSLRPIFNNMVCPQGWNLSTRGNVHPFIHLLWVNTLYSLEEWRGEQRISPLGGQLG